MVARGFKDQPSQTQVNIKARATIWTDEVTSAESLGSDFIGNRSASQYSQRIVNHAFYHPVTGIHGVGTDMGGDDHIRKAEERMVPATRDRSGAKIKNCISGFSCVGSGKMNIVSEVTCCSDTDQQSLLRSLITMELCGPTLVAVQDKSHLKRRHGWFLTGGRRLERPDLPPDLMHDGEKNSDFKC